MTVASRDTDGLLVVASPDGQRPGEISWAALDEVLARFDSLAPFGSDVPVWKVKREHDGQPLTAVVIRRKRYAIGVGSGVSVHLVDAPEHVLGGVFVGPPDLVGRDVDGRHRWTRRVATRLLAEATGDGPGSLLPAGAGRFPALRRFQVASPAALAELPEALGVRPFGLYVEGLPDPLYGDSVTPRALDPGGNLADWRELRWCRPDGSSVRVATEPTAGAVVLWTLEGRAQRWATPRREERPVPVVVLPELIRKVGRLGVLVEAATVDPFDDHEGLRAVYDEGDPATFVAAEARRLGPTEFALRYSVPIGTAEKVSVGRRPNPATIRLVLAGLSSTNNTPRTCAFDGCDQPIVRHNAKYCRRSHADRAYRSRLRAKASRSDSAESPSCRVCHGVMLGAADRGDGVCFACEDGGAS